MVSNDHIYTLAQKRYIQLGVNISNSGFKYLCDATVLEYLNTYRYESLRYSIYHEIALKHGSTYSCVERSIRYALSSAYDNNRERFLRMLTDLAGEAVLRRPEAMILIGIIAMDIAVATDRAF